MYGKNHILHKMSSERKEQPRTYILVFFNAAKAASLRRRKKIRDLGAYLHRSSSANQPIRKNPSHLKPMSQ